MMKQITIAALTGGRNVPSARFRVRQYIDHLAGEGVEVTEFPAPWGMYPPFNVMARPAWCMASLFARLPTVLQSYRYDLTLLQREMLSTFVTLEPFTKRPRILDVDDAIWLHPRGQFAARLASKCEGVLCGNAFLADYFRQWNPNVTIIPTAVDTDRYIQGKSVDAPIIGWSGTSSGLKYVYEIEPALAAVLQKVPSAKLRIVCDAMPTFRTIPTSRAEFIRWSPANEVRAIQEMAVGIMPLDDSLWVRGKCSFKMLTYMACGIPVVVSPVGMNAEILTHGRVGFGVSTLDEWVDSLLQLAGNIGQRVEMGKIGRQTVLDNYSVNVIAPRLAQALIRVANANR